MELTQFKEHLAEYIPLFRFLPPDESRHFKNANRSMWPDVPPERFVDYVETDMPRRNLTAAQVDRMIEIEACLCTVMQRGSREKKRIQVLIAKMQAYDSPSWQERANRQIAKHNNDICNSTINNWFNQAVGEVFTEFNKRYGQLGRVGVEIPVQSAVIASSRM